MIARLVCCLLLDSEGGPSIAITLHCTVNGKSRVRPLLIIGSAFKLYACLRAIPVAMNINVVMEIQTYGRSSSCIDVDVGLLFGEQEYLGKKKQD